MRFAGPQFPKTDTESIAANNYVPPKRKQIYPETIPLFVFPPTKSPRKHVRYAQLIIDTLTERPRLNRTASIQIIISHLHSSSIPTVSTVKTTRQTHRRPATRKPPKDGDTKRANPSASSVSTRRHHTYETKTLIPKFMLKKDESYHCLWWVSDRAWNQNRQL